MTQCLYVLVIEKSAVNESCLLKQLYKNCVASFGYFIDYICLNKLKPVFDRIIKTFIHKLDKLLR